MDKESVISRTEKDEEGNFSQENLSVNDLENEKSEREELPQENLPVNNAENGKDEKEELPQENPPVNAQKNEKSEKEILLQEIPPINDLRMELAREEARHDFRKSLLNITGILTVAAAITALMMTRLLILLQVNGNSMYPSLEDREVVILRQTKEIEKGDIVGFYYGGKILLKRVIGSAGDEIDIDQEGNVSVNGERINEPYVEEKRLGKCDQDFPYKVPEDMIFVLGDNRAVSLDSRIKSIGCVEKNQIVGKAAFRIWPSGRIGRVH